MRAVVFTLGCKVNEVESACIMASLEESGWEVDDKLSFADAYILNTCAVTREAEKKSRQLVTRARKFNPSAKIFICGCASEKSKESFEEKGVNFICGARDKEAVVKAVCAEFGGECAGFAFAKQTKTRAFIKIQDGCNNFCSYCIIPYLRGREKSRPIEDILKEISSCDSPEIVLNGINISSYNDGGGGLEKLIYALQPVKKRIRLGSLECNVITDDFLMALKGLYDFAPQFHLSLQSGSDRVLSSMNRHYTRAEYIQKTKHVLRFFPDAAITTDIISGFPTESEEDFLGSISIIKEVGFARVHAFSFSPREGTVAYRMKDLPAQVKSERLAALIEAAKVAESQYVLRFFGKTLHFIAEEIKDGYTTGYTGNYIKVYIKEEVEIGKKYAVKLIAPYLDGAEAVIDED